MLCARGVAAPACSPVVGRLALGRRPERFMGVAGYHQCSLLGETVTTSGPRQADMIRTDAGSNLALVSWNFRSEWN
jgi:hypothetical protein